VMRIFDLHPWDVTYREAIKIQEQLKGKVILGKIASSPNYIAGLDVSYEKGTHRVWAGAVILGFPDMAVVEKKWAQREVCFPYVPGLLSFREIPALLDVLTQITVEPDVIFCDGQGVAHPRGLGIASHLGVILRKPTIGCAKSRLVGDCDPVGEWKGDYSFLRYRGRIIGAVMRTRQGVKPLFVSPGYGVTLDDCIGMVLKMCPRYRIPEPIRQAHILVNSIRSKSIEG
jgi:deoxyribonuclease V